MASMHDLLEETRKRLVETGTRNRLIHVNRKAKRANVLNIINERSDDIFQLLRVDSKKMRFAAKGSEEDEELQDGISLASDTEEEFDESRYTDLFLETPLTSDGLQKRLLRLASNARTAEEEQGINILYLALGFLDWYEDANSSVLRESPLILIPVELIRNERTSKYELKCRDEDIVANLPLQERLINDFGISPPEIDDSQDWTPSQYFSEVSDAISGQSRWSIDSDGMQLGFFSFAKLLMLRDLDPENWSESTLLHNELVKGLLADGFESEPSLFKEDTYLDDVLEPKDMFHVVDADSSQTKVIEEVKSGRNLVVQGPPGTGKSQTITNILAAAAHSNKTVLFVAEKMAALDVVHQRMLKAGLKDLCLELHSRSANKKAFLNELAETLSNGRRVEPVGGDVSDLKTTRDTLNRITNDLHSPIPGMDYTPFDVLSVLIDFVGRNVTPPKLDLSSSDTISVSDEEKICEGITQYIDIVQQYGTIQEHAFSGTTQLDLQPTDLHRLNGELGVAIAAIDEWQSNHSGLAEMLGKNAPESLQVSVSLEDVARQFKKIPNDVENVLDVCYSNARDQRFIESIEIAKTWISTKQSLTDVVNDSAWSQSVEHLRGDLVKGLNSWISRVFGKYRNASKELGTLTRSELPKSAKDRLAFIDSLIEAQSKKRDFDDEEGFLKQKLGELWRGERTDFGVLISNTQWLCNADCILLEYSISELRSLITQEKIRQFDFELSAAQSVGVVDSSMTVARRLGLSDLSEEELSNVNISALRSRFQSMVDSPESYDVWVRFTYAHEFLKEHGLEKLLAALERKELEIDSAKEEFLYSLYESRWDRIRKLRPELDALARTNRHQIVELFKTSEEKRGRDVQGIIRSKHLAQMPQGSAGEMGLIRGEIAKKRRHKPIRQVISHAGSMVQRIKPVFLMSPISVAQYLPPGKISFDLLVIDEASQVRPEDALGSIARCSQIVVVGDQKQLPPTSFFDRLTDNIESTDDDEDASDELPTAKAIEMESILSLCEARGISQSMLEWHYRSRDPSLIAVSNLEFYKNRLILPPCPTQGDENYGLKLTQVSGVYSSKTRGGGRPGTNRIEAEAIGSRLAELAVTRPQFSVGVVTFSKAQANMVTEVLELMRRTDSNLDAFLKDGKQENVFVKNIENVQGDERDIILISVGYGPHEPNAKLASMSFGPINSEGGERRLNVLFSRSRIACEVFTSFDPRDIDLSRTKKEGSRVLKRFLEFAKSGQIEEISPTGEEPDSPFEEDVARVIRSLGFPVDYQVGTAGFKIDLGVRSNDGSDHYVLAVECDGATYHSALWARERDRMRQEILEGFGWTFHRIWSTDWFHRRTSEIERLKQAIETAQERDLSLSIKGSNHTSSVKFEPDFFQIDRENLDLLPAEIKVPAYEKAEPKVNYRYEPHECPVSRIADLAIGIVSVEGPVHVDEIARRYAEAYGKTRVGSRISAAVKNGVLSAERDGRIVRSGEFWGTKQQFENVPVRDRENESPPLTKPNYISEEEIKACAALIDKESGSMDIEELIRTISKVFGFKRAGPDFQKRVRDVLK